MLKKTAKYIYAAYLYHFGLKKRIEYLKKNKSIIAIYDHNPSPEDFEKYIKWLLGKGFEFISLNEVLNYLDGKTKPENSKIWFTLDDGWRGNLALLPVIEKYRIPVTIFITTHAVETGFFRDTLEETLTDELPLQYQGDIHKLHEIPNKERAEADAPLYEKAKDVLEREAVNVNELKALAKHSLISIGLHTHTHPVLPHCSKEKIAEEINNNREKLVAYTGAASSVLALPYGRYNEKAVQVLKENNILYVATSDSGLIDRKAASVLPRNGIAQASFYENCCRMLDFWYPNVARLNSILKI